MPSEEHVHFHNEFSYISGAMYASLVIVHVCCFEAICGIAVHVKILSIVG
jgi:hypothetical protein